MASRSGPSRPPPVLTGPSILRLTDLTITSDGWYKASRFLELVIDGQTRAAVFQTKKTDLVLQWTVNPSVIISNTAIIVIQPYEARQLIRRKRVDPVTILGDAVHRACAGKTGEKHEYVHRATGFRISLGVTLQRDVRARDKSQSGFSAFDTPGDPGDVSFGPHTAPNSWKKALNAMNDIKKVFAEIPDSWGPARSALKTATDAMPPYEADEDLQRLGEQIYDLLSHMQHLEYSEKLHTQSATVMSVFYLIANAALCAEDYSKPDAKDNASLSEFRHETIANFTRRFSRLKRNFNEGKNMGMYDDIYLRPRPPTPPSPVEDEKSEVMSEPESEKETRSITGEEDDTLMNNLDPQFTPTDLLNLCCLEGTRTDILDEITHWFDDEKAPNVLWLCGGPGTGKTSIAWNLIAELEKQQRSASEFFFRRSSHDPYQLWRTTAYKLAKFHPALKASVYEALVENSEVISTISSCFENLVEKPLRTTVDRFGDKGPVLLIDGLEQCGHSSPDWEDVLQTLSKWLELPSKCKIVITSRPQDDISKVFEGKDIKRMDLKTGDDADYGTNNDIHTYLDHRFTALKAQNKTLPESWPEYDDVRKLSNHAAGLFMWAKIAADSIAAAPDIERQFSNIISSGVTTKFDALDEFFNDILSSTFPSDPAPTFRATMGAIALAKAPLTMKDLQHLFSDRFDSNSVEEISFKLLPIVAINDEDQHLTLRHRSIVEFLTDPKRVGEDSNFFVDKSKTSRNFTVACLKLMQSGLKFNICDLKSSYQSNEDIPNRAELIDKSIPSHLSYACKYWADHLRDVTDKRDSEIVNLVKNILQNRFFFWLEVLSLIDEVDIAPRLLLAAADWLEMSDKELAAFAADASRFALTFRDPIAYSVPHIYVSALPLAPVKSRIYKHYKAQFPRTFQIMTDGKNDGWPAMRFAFRMPDYVQSFSVHPDGKRIVTALNDPVVQVWSMATGLSVLKLHGHTSTVRTAVYSPSGKRIATGGDDRTIRIWDADTGNCLYGPYEIHGDWVRCVGWSPDGTKLVSGSDDRTVKVIAVETGATLFDAVSVHTDWVRTVAFHPDGNHVISGSDDRTVRIWEAATGSLVGDPLTGHTGYIRAIAISPDGNRLASGSDDSRIILYDMATKTQLGQSLKGHTGSVRSLAFSADSKLLASCGEDYTVRLWNVETRKKHCDQLQGHTSYVSSVMFSPDMKQIISGGEDSSIRAWDMDALPMWRPTLEATGPFQAATPMADGKRILASDGSNIWTWHFETGAIETVAFDITEDFTIQSTAFSPDGTRAATGASDRMVYIWDTATGKRLLGPFEGHSDDIYGIAFSSDGRRVASGSDDYKVWVWDAETGKSICGPLEGQHEGLVRAVSFSPDGQNIASAAHDRSMVIWKIETGEPVHPVMRQHSDWVNAIAYSPDGRYLASASDDYTTLIWDTDTGEVVFQPLRGHTQYLREVAWSPDSKRVVSGGLDKTILVFDIETGATICGPLHGHTSEITSVAFSSDGSKVISASADGTIRIWDIRPRSFTRSATFSDHGDWVHSVALSPDGSYVASGGDDCNVLVQDVSTGVERFPALSGHEDWIRGVCYSPDGAVLASCSDDGTIRLWNARTGGDHIGEPLRGHGGSVLSISFAPDGKRLASGGEDSNIRIWDVESPKEAKVLQVFSDHRRDVNSIAFSPDGGKIVSGSAAGDIIVRDLTAANAVATVSSFLASFSHPTRSFGGDGVVLCVAFSPDGNRVVSAGEKTPTRVWDVATGQQITSIAKGHVGPVHSVVFSPDGKQIISGGEDTTIRIWDAELGAALSMPLRGHLDKVLSIAISQDASRLVSGSADNAVAAWELHLDRRMLWPDSFMRRVHDTEFCAVDEEGVFSDTSTVEDGWVRGAKSELLFWIPPMYRTGLWMPQTVGIMGTPETIIDLRRYAHGTSWHQCLADPPKY